MKKSLILIIICMISVSAQAQTWNQLTTPNTRNLYGCWFDETHPDTGMAVGWYIQNFDRLPFGFYTTNGGSTITSGSLFQIYFYASSDVWFTNSYNGIVVGNGIIQTTNGGASWNLIVDAASTQAGILENVMFTNSTDGYAVGQRYDFSYTSFEGMLYKTTNAGGSWSDFTVSQEVNSENTQLHAVYSTGGGVIYAGGENNIGGASTLFKSNDDGLNWTGMAFSQNIFSLYFTSPDTGYAACTNGLYKTTNAGMNWVNILPTNSALHAIQIKNGFGFTAGANGLMYMTNDNGNSWNPMTIPVSNTISDISILSPNLAYAVGASGTFLKYTNSVSLPETNIAYDIDAWIDDSHQLHIKFNNTTKTTVSIELINFNGSSVRQIANQHIQDGRHEFKSDINSLANGIYLIKMVIGNETVNRKILLIK
ncbi:MAG: T9SS type A sorting domain-containing protein [Bacteroidetes bacterium]|nr:T9SS type A sorting domain-containing protein [Bacteroidota bacterium]